MKKVKGKKAAAARLTKKPSVKPAPQTSRLRFLAKWVGLPLLIYFAFFCLFTWPWISQFNSRFMTDGGDGLQNVWNIWWVNKSVTELHQLPWHTNFLHYPFGVTLLGQTLNPFNGFIAIGLLKFLSLNQAFNAMMVFSFVAGGLTAFWLSYEFSKSYIASLFGGFLFTFSSYHFAHAIGHMQLVSLEWIPLFLLLWWRLLKKPNYWLAVGAATALSLTLLCDYYYFLFSLITACFMLLYLWRKRELAPIKASSTYRPWLVFIVLSLLIVAPLPVALLRQNSHDELQGSHPTRLFSTDIVTPFLDGGFWRFHSLTDGYWHHIKAYIAESSIYVTTTVLVIFVIAWFKRKNIGKYLDFWQLTVLFFGVMSLGPRLMVFGYSINHAPMPYIIMEKVIPGFKLSGVPIRMMLMVILSLAIIVAMTLAKLDLKQTKHKLLMGLVAILLIFELWPSPLPTHFVTQPKYVEKLRQLPYGAVFDNAALSESDQLYHQTTYEKPMAYGYISRKPKSLDTKEFPLFAYNVQNKQNLYCSQFKIRYFTTPPHRPLKVNVPIIYQDKDAIIYDLKDSPNC